MTTTAARGDAPFLLPAPELGAWRAGNTGVEGVWHFDSGRPGRRVAISALVHGNELCGAWAVLGLLASGLRPVNGSLTLAFCNLAAFDRFDPGQADASRFVEQDLNRQWSAERLAQGAAGGGSLEQRRAAELAPWIERSDWLLDLHSMHEPSAPLLLTGTQPENVQLALSMGAPTHIVVDAGHKDGVRMRDFGHFGTRSGMAAGARSLLIECGFHGDLASRAVAQDQCRRFLALSGVVDPGALGDWALPDAATRQVLEVAGGAVAKTDGASFVRHFEGLECIEHAGTVLGHDGEAPIVTPFDDCVLVMPSLRQAKPGVTVVRFGRKLEAGSVSGS